MIGGRSALLGAAGGNPYGNWTGNYSDVSLLLRGNTGPVLVPADESPSPKTITAVGNASVTTAIAKWNQGSGGSSLVFYGNGDYLTTPASNDFLFGTGDFTIECWIYKTATTAQSTILANLISSGSGSDIWIFVNSNNAIVTSTWFTFLSTSASNVVSNNNWFHIAWTRAGTTSRIFVNGQIVNTYTLSTNFTRNTGPTIGAYGGGGDPFTGLIDDLRITKGIARYVEGTGANAGKMVFAGTNNLAHPLAELPANVTDDPSYNSVSLLLRNGVPGGPLVPADESPSPKSITAVGNAGISTTTFKYGDSSLAFDGTGDYLSIPQNTAFDFGLGDFTIEAWVRIASLSGKRAIVSYRQAGIFRTDAAFDLSIEPSGVLEAQICSDNSLFIIGSSVALQLGQWQHIALVRNAGLVRCYVNGVGGSEVSVNATINSPANRLIVIGALHVSSNFLNGFIDDLRITKGVARYTKNFLPPPAQLPAI